MSHSPSSRAAPSGVKRRPGAALDRALRPDPRPRPPRHPARAIAYRAVTLDDRGDDRAILFRQELGGVVAHVAQTLHDHPLALDAARQAGMGHVLGVAEELAQRILHAPPRGLDPALDAARVQGLAGDAGLAVDVGGVHPRVLIGDPGHLAFARAHVGGGHVLGRVDQVALDQLVGKAAGDLLQLVRLPRARVDAQPPLRSAEGRFHQRAFVGHQRRQRLDLVLIDRKRIADAALDRLHMFGMDRPVAGEGLDLAAQAHAEAHGVGGVADADLLLQPRAKVHQRDGAVEHQVHGFTETRFASDRHSSPPLRPRPARLWCGATGPTLGEAAARVRPELQGRRPEADHFARPDHAERSIRPGAGTRHRVIRAAPPQGLNPRLKDRNRPIGDCLPATHSRAERRSTVSAPPGKAARRVQVATISPKALQ